MSYRATLVSNDPLNYFLQQDDGEPHLRVSDVILRANHDPKEIFSALIRLGTHSNWSHSALLYLINDPPQGFDNTFIVEALTSGVHVVSWRDEISPLEKFTVGLRRLPLDWYTESPREIARHDPDDPEDIPGIAYLRHVRGMALDQVNRLYDHNTIYELTALYAEHIVRQYFGGLPVAAEAAARIANFFRRLDQAAPGSGSVLRFICSGLVQYSFFAALRVRIINDLAIPAHRDAAMSNLANMHRIIFHEDPDGIIANYVQQAQSGKLDIGADVPDEVIDLLKTTTPADFNTSNNLQWRYIIRAGGVWRIDAAPDGYTPQSDAEAAVLKLIVPAA